MRRGIKPGPEPRSPEHTGEHIRNRTLSVRPGNMDDLVCAMRMAGKLVEEFHVGYPGLVCRCAGFLK